MEDSYRPIAAVRVSSEGVCLAAGCRRSLSETELAVLGMTQSLAPLVARRRQRSMSRALWSLNGSHGLAPGCQLREVSDWS